MAERRRARAEGRHWPLATILSVVLGGFVALAVAVPATIGWLTTGYLTGELLSEKAIRAMESLDRGLAEHLEPAARQIEAVGGLLAEGRVAPTDRSAVEALLLAGLAANGTMSSMTYVDVEGAPVGVRRLDDGRLEVATFGGSRADRAARLAEVEATTGLMWGEVFFVRSLGDAIVNVRYPVRRDGRYLGFLGAAITVARLSQLVERIGQPAGLEGFILYGQDQVLAHRDMIERDSRPRRMAPLTDVAEFGDATLRDLATGRQARGLTRAREVAGVDGRRVGSDRRTDTLVIFKELNRYGPVPWTIGFVVPDEQIDPVLGPIRGMGVAAVLLPILALLAALWLGRLLARPIGRTTEAVEQVSTLDLTQVQPLPRSRVLELDRQATSFNAMLATLRAFGTYVPLGLVQRLIHEGDVAAIVSRERDLTLMFTDIVGFTRIAETLPPDRVAELLNHHFAMLAGCVEAEDGTVDKYLGDGMMAFWGAPRRIKHRAERACAAALAIRTAIEADNRERRRQGLPAICVRIGIHRGRLVVGNIGAPGRINYTAVGDTTNVAQRLEDAGRLLVEHDEVAIVVSEAVVAEAGTGFCFQPMPRINVKGRDEPVQAYSLLGKSTAPPVEAPSTLAKIA